jgi:hypothetical protein
MMRWLDYRLALIRILTAGLLLRPAYQHP